MSKQLPGNGKPTDTMSVKELKNDYRDQLAKEQDPIKFETDKVGEEEMIRRDQYVTMIHLEHEQVMRDCDAAHIKAAIKSYNDLLEELKDMPLCEAREGVKQVIQQQLKKLEAQLAQSILPRVSVVSLDALRKLFQTTEISTSCIADEDSSGAGAMDNSDKPLEDGKTGNEKDVQDNVEEELTANEDDPEEAI